MKAFHFETGIHVFKATTHSLSNQVSMHFLNLSFDCHRRLDTRLIDSFKQFNFKTCSVHLYHQGNLCELFNLTDTTALEFPQESNFPRRQRLAWISLLTPSETDLEAQVLFCEYEKSNSLNFLMIRHGKSKMIQI